MRKNDVCGTFLSVINKRKERRKESKKVVDIWVAKRELKPF